MQHVRQPAPKLNFKMDSERAKVLKMQGVDGAAFQMLRNPFLLDDALVKINPTIPAWLPDDYSMRSMSVKRQVEACSRMLTNPLHGSPIIGIGSMVSDDRAKFLAMCFMDAAIDQMRQGSHRGKKLPIWHRVVGGFTDSLRDQKEMSNISMLVITNVGPDSTSAKIEKVRDLLDMYHGIPRIVVVNGADPITFFSEKIRMSMQFAIFMNSRRSDKRDLLSML